MKRIVVTSILIVSLINASTAQDIGAREDDTPTVKNIILMIGDGMGTTQVCAGLTASSGSLRMTESTNIGFSTTNSDSDYITDSGAAGTALATGYKTYDRAIGVDADTVPRTTILEYAEKYGKKTGLIATSTITHATPASFIAHQPSRYMYEAIAQDFLNTDIDVFVGGGLNHFKQREDGQDLTRKLEEKGYAVITNLDELPECDSEKIAGLIYPDDPPRWRDGRQDMLNTSVQKALEVLDNPQQGFFLMVEGSQIDWGGHDQDLDYIVEELIDFDNTVGTVLDFAAKDGQTLVIVTADHETGGMSLVGGDVATGKLQANFSTGHHSGVMVPVFAFGQGAEHFRGVYDNTDIFHKMMLLFGFSESTKNESTNPVSN